MRSGTSTRHREVLALPAIGLTADCCLAEQLIRFLCLCGAKGRVFKGLAYSVQDLLSYFYIVFLLYWIYFHKSWQCVFGILCISYFIASTVFYVTFYVVLGYFVLYYINFVLCLQKKIQFKMQEKNSSPNFYSKNRFLFIHF